MSIDRIAGIYSEASDLSPQGRRAIVVGAALELLKAELSASGKSLTSAELSMSGKSSISVVGINKVRQYANLIEEALDVNKSEVGLKEAMEAD